MDYPIRIKLLRPITYEETTYAELVFDEPTVGGSIAVQEAAERAKAAESAPDKVRHEADATTELLASMAGVPREVILRIRESDFAVVTDKVLKPRFDSISDEGGDGGNGPDAG